MPEGPAFPSNGRDRQSLSDQTNAPSSGAPSARGDEARSKEVQGTVLGLGVLGWSQAASPRLLLSTAKEARLGALSDSKAHVTEATRQGDGHWEVTSGD